MAAFTAVTAAPTTATTTPARSTRRPAGRRPPRCPTLTAAIAAGTHSAAVIPKAAHGHATSADVQPVCRRRSRRRSSPPTPSVAVGTPPRGGESAALPADHVRRVPLATEEVVTAPGTPVDAVEEAVESAFVARLQAALNAVVEERNAAAAAAVARVTATVEAATVTAAASTAFTTSYRKRAAPTAVKLVVPRVKPAVQSKGRAATKRSRPASVKTKTTPALLTAPPRSMAPVNVSVPPTVPAAPKEPEAPTTPVANSHHRWGRRLRMAAVAVVGVALSAGVAVACTRRSDEE